MKPSLANILVGLFTLIAAGAAHAGSGGWVAADEVIEAGGEAEASDYEIALAEGDDKTLMAANDAASPATIKKLINAAVRAYERAAKADPTKAEPHYRAANVLFGFFLDCDDSGPRASPLCDPENAKLFRRVVDHWHAFEERAPLDPRIPGFLFDRAILHTKLATEDDLRLGIADYQALLDRPGVWIGQDRGTILGNLAESHMMLGDLDAAIESYRAAVLEPSGGRTSIFYGLAVAYDRDGQGAKAREIITAFGEDAFQKWGLEVIVGDTFYVPEGEVYYYYALAYQALGHDQEAAKNWQRFLDSGAHPIYQPRARAHLAALKAKKP
jgi:tetratricopeptide (TPR) repeat protein